MSRARPIRWDDARPQRVRQTRRGPAIDAGSDSNFQYFRYQQNGKTPLDLAVNDAMRRALREHAMVLGSKSAPRTDRRAQLACAPSRSALRNQIVDAAAAVAYSRVLFGASSHFVPPLITLPSEPQAPPTATPAAARRRRPAAASPRSRRSRLRPRRSPRPPLPLPLPRRSRRPRSPPSSPPAPTTRCGPCGRRRPSPLRPSRPTRFCAASPAGPRCLPVPPRLPASGAHTSSLSLAPRPRSRRTRASAPTRPSTACARRPRRSARSSPARRRSAAARLPRRRRSAPTPPPTRSAARSSCPSARRRTRTRTRPCAAASPRPTCAGAAPGTRPERAWRVWFRGVTSGGALS